MGDDGRDGDMTGEGGGSSSSDAHGEAVGAPNGGRSSEHSSDCGSVSGRKRSHGNTMSSRNERRKAARAAKTSAGST